MSRYSLRTRSSYANETHAWEDDFTMHSNESKSLLANKRTAERLESNLSPGILKKFQKMTTFSPKKPRSLKRSMAAHSSKKSSKKDCMDLKEDTDTLMNCNTNSASTLEHLGMTDADMLVVALPDRYNYQVWEDPSLLEEPREEVPKKPVVFDSEEKENIWRPSAILHAFSPFKKNREERALKALSIASFPEYLQLKGQFFNDLGKSFFKRKEKDTSRFKATKINLFRNRYQPSFPIVSNATNGGLNAKNTNGVDPICKIPTPEFAKPVLVRSTSIRYSPIEQSQKSAFKSVKKDDNPSISQPKEDNNFNDTPFNTPRSEFINRTMNCPLNRSSESVTKRNLRPRPTRPPTLFGFSSDFSEDDVCTVSTCRKK